MTTASRANEMGGAGAATAVTPVTPKLSKKTPVKGTGPDPSKPKPVKAKQARREKQLLKKQQQQQQQQSEMETENPAASSPVEDPAAADAGSRTDDAGKSLEDLIAEGEALKDPKVRFEVRLVRSHPPSPEFEASFAETYQLYKKYQTTVHGDDPDEVKEKQFKRFLCDSPLSPAPTASPSVSLGSFHQQYLVDGRIVAVGVVDLLPRCVSSVYLFYDPAFDFLSLGTFSALREIAFTRSLARLVPTLKEYYMGFYIHSCPKMRYKGAYRPSLLLCPEKLSWVPIESCVPKLDATKYSRFAENGNDDDEGRKNFDGDLSGVLVLHNRLPMTYATYRRYSPLANDEDEVRGYAELVGQSCHNMLLYRKRARS